jgi:hypothetical protein
VSALTLARAMARAHGVQAMASISGAPTLTQLQQAQDVLRAAGGDTVGPEVKHFFGDGLYGRMMEIPAGVLLIGKIHRKAGITVQLYGDTEVTSPGQPPQRITGPRVWESPGGTKRMIYAHVPSLWIALHATDETDMGAVEADLIVPEENPS